MTGSKKGLKSGYTSLKDSNYLLWRYLLYEKSLNSSMLSKRNLIAFFLTIVLADCGAAERVVRGLGMEWKPSVVFVELGDKIRFMEMLGHDTESIEGMIPLDSSGWKSKIGEEGFTVIPDTEGLYVYKCNPHVAAGMFGAIIVGERKKPANFEQVLGNLHKVRIGRSSVKKILQKVLKSVGSKS